jgi:hypothetical protein
MSYIQEMKLTPFRKLDEVLNIMCPRNNDPAGVFNRVSVMNILKTSFDFTDKEAGEISNQMPQILDKLDKDGYIMYDLERYNKENLEFKGAAFKWYMVTFDGELFNSKGGYRKQSRNKRIELWFKGAVTFSLIFGGVAAGVYYLVELFH